MKIKEVRERNSLVINQIIEILIKNNLSIRNAKSVLESTARRIEETEVTYLYEDS